MAISFGKYQLVRRLAVGGMAEVFLGVAKGEAGFKKHVAIKRILPHLSEEKEFISMFFDEARILARFSHPNIVQIYDLGRVKNTYFLAMEFVHGLTMFRVINLCAKKKLKLPLDIGVKIASDTCDALDYAHSYTKQDGTPLEIVHRDVSTQNIMLSVDGVVKVLDFGIAKAVGNLSRTRPTWLKGKAMYMSPEQIQMQEDIDRRSDIFSLGTLLYIFATQRRPFKGENEYQLMMSIVHDSAPDPREYDSTIPIELVNIIARALEKEREKRYQTAREMREDLEHFLFGRKSRMDNHALAAFLNKLAPLKKKTTGQTRRVPTKSIQSPLESSVPALAFQEIYADPEEPLVLKPKNRDEPILLLPKKQPEPEGVPGDLEAGPIREVKPSPQLEMVPIEESVTPPEPEPFATPTPTETDALDTPAPLPAEEAKTPPPPEDSPVTSGVSAPVRQPRSPALDPPLFASMTQPRRIPAALVVFLVLVLVGSVVGLLFYTRPWGSEAEKPGDSPAKTDAGNPPVSSNSIDREGQEPSERMAGDSAQPETKEQDRVVTEEPSVASVSKPAPVRRNKRRRRRRRPVPVDPVATGPKTPGDSSASATPGEGTDAGTPRINSESAGAADAGPPKAEPPPVTPEKPAESPPPRIKRPPLEEPPDPVLVEEPAHVPGKDMTGGKKVAKVASTPPKPDLPVKRVVGKPVFQRSGTVRKRRIGGSDPVYPAIARQAHVEATVVVKLTITREGRVGQFRFLKTHEAFEKTVTEALRSWRFSPYLVKGKPVSTYTLYKFVFKLD